VGTDNKITGGAEKIQNEHSPNKTLQHCFYSVLMLASHLLYYFTEQASSFFLRLPSSPETLNCAISSLLAGE
jgi:hypothetical protein